VVKFVLLGEQRAYKRLVTLDDHSAAVTSVRFASHGNRLLSCAADRNIVFRDLEEGGDETADVQRVQVPGRGPLYDMQLETTEK
jgi:WD40 repeat protein